MRRWGRRLVVEQIRCRRGRRPPATNLVPDVPPSSHGVGDVVVVIRGYQVFECEDRRLLASSPTSVSPYEHCEGSDLYLSAAV